MIANLVQGMEWAVVGAGRARASGCTRCWVDGPRGLEASEWKRAFSRLAGPMGLTHPRSTVAPRDVIQALCEAVRPGAGVSERDFEAAAEEFLACEVAVPVLEGDVQHDGAMPDRRRAVGEQEQSRER